MRPTINDQVSGALRLLDELGSGAELSPASLDSLDNVRRLLKQVGRSWAALPGFYSADNGELMSLLERARPVVSAGLTGRIGATAAGDGAVGTDIVASARVNAELRGLLSDVLRELPADADGRALRRQIGDYLRRRVAADPH